MCTTRVVAKKATETGKGYRGRVTTTKNCDTAGREVIEAARWQFLTAVRQSVGGNHLQWYCEGRERSLFLAESRDDKFEHRKRDLITSEDGVYQSRE